ncbi:MAG: HlyD family type I secretion periplasmic adaptor subunit, partial [Alphaproteobacteria bacterium]
MVEARQRLEEERLKFRRIALEELSRVELQIAQSNETLTKATDQVLRAEIRSPIDGVVKSVRYHTIGGVVSP